MTKAQQADRDDAIKELRKLCRPGTKVYTTVTHVARSGMSRSIRVLLMRKDGPRELTGLAARALDYRQADHGGGLKVGGCGMDMGFHVVHSLSYALHGTKDVGADAIDEGMQGRPYTPRPGHYRAGYSLIQQWL